MNCNPSWWTATKSAPERDPLDAELRQCLHDLSRPATAGVAGTEEA